MRAVLISTYELGHQPFGLASPAAWLRARGATVTCLDLSREDFRKEAVGAADLVAFYVPMHTATRLAANLVARVREFNPRAHLCFYGLYAPVNEGYLRGLGVQTILGGEFEAGLARLAASLEKAAEPAAPVTPVGPVEPVISLERLNFIVPDRAGLPPLSKYAHLLLRGWPLAHRGIHRSQPRLQTPVPPLPRGSGLPRHVPDRAAGGGAGRYSPPGGRRRPAHYVWRSGFFQWPGARRADCGGAAPRVAVAYLRRHYQDGAPAESLRVCCPFCKPRAACS